LVSGAEPCITGNEEHIMVEIQCAPQIYFIERVLTYVARLINALSDKGKKWNFNLPKIYSLNILDFTFEEAMKPAGIELKKVDPNKYISKVQLIDCETKELFYSKLTLSVGERSRTMSCRVFQRNGMM